MASCLPMHVATQPPQAAAPPPSAYWELPSGVLCGLFACGLALKAPHSAHSCCGTHIWHMTYLRHLSREAS